MQLLIHLPFSFDTFIGIQREENSTIQIVPVDW